MLLQKNLSSIMKMIYADRHQTLDEFSEELGISRTSLQKILKGTSNPTMDTIEQIAKELQVDPSELLFPLDANTSSIARIIHKVSCLDPEQQQLFMMRFGEIVRLLNSVDGDE